MKLEDLLTAQSIAAHAAAPLVPTPRGQEPPRDIDEKLARFHADARELLNYFDADLHWSGPECVRRRIHDCIRELESRLAQMLA